MKILSRSVVLMAIVAATCGAAAASAVAAPLAFTANFEGDSVSVINTATNALVGKPIPVGKGPYSIAVTPDGRRAYVVNATEDTVDAIDTATLKTVGEPIEVGEIPTAIAISPDGRTAYVSDEKSDEVSVINLRTGGVTSVPGIESAYGIAVAPDGESIYVTNVKEKAVTVIDAKTLQAGAPINVGAEPVTVTFAPNGRTAFVADYASQEVSVIETATGAVRPIEVGEKPWGLALTPDAQKLFVANFGEGTVSVVNTVTDAVIGEFEVGKEPYEFGMEPDGKIVYLAEFGSEDVLPIDTQADKPAGPPIEISGEKPWQVAVTPDQSPTAAFSAPTATATLPTTFSGAASTDPDGSVTSWNWAFGDGGTATGVAPTHSYGAPGTFAASLGVVDNEGCSTAEVFTGRTAYCSGGASSVTDPVTVAPAPIAAPAPSNKFRFGRLVHDTRNGTARLQVKVPAAGSIVLFGKQVHEVRKKAGAATSLWLTIHARVELNKRLKKIHRTTVKVRITFTPTGGIAKTVHRSIVLLHAPSKKHPRASH
jgi:YVTN family beta-propeller protein